MKFIDDQKLIIFNNDEHRYFDLNGKELLSITKFIDFFSTPFDPDGSILKRKAAEKGIKPSQLKKEWNKMGTDAGNIGTFYHKNIEYYLNTGKIRKNKTTNVVNKFAQEYKIEGKIFSEVRIFNSSIGLCGTSDLVNLINDKMINIQDIKTNKKIPDDWSFYKKMKYPLNHLNDSKLNKYILQISIYNYLLCLNYNLIPGNDNCIYWVNRKKEEIKKIPIQLKTKEVIDMISVHFFNKNNPNFNNEKSIDNPPLEQYNDEKSADSDFGF